MGAGVAGSPVAAHWISAPVSRPATATVGSAGEAQRLPNPGGRATRPRPTEGRRQPRTLARRIAHSALDDSSLRSMIDDLRLVNEPAYLVRNFAETGRQSKDAHRNFREEAGARALIVALSGLRAGLAERTGGKFQI